MNDEEGSKPSSGALLNEAGEDPSGGKKGIGVYLFNRYTSIQRKYDTWANNAAENSFKGKLAARLTALGRAVYRYVKEILLDEPLKGFKITRKLWSMGLFGRMGLAAILWNTIATVVFVAERSIYPEYSQQNTLMAAGLIIGLLGMALGWSFSVAAAMHFPLSIYAIICVYLTWYNLVIGGSIHRTLLFALPMLWMIFVGFMIGRKGGERGRWLWLALLCMGGGYLAFVPLGLSRIIPPPYHVPARLLLGVVLFVIYHGLLIPRPGAERARLNPPLSQNFVFWGTLLLAVIFFGASTVRDPAQTADNVFLASQSLLAPLSLFWMWMGARLFDGASSMGDWVSEAAVGLFSKRVMRVVFPLVWITATILMWLAVSGNVPAGIAQIDFIGRIVNWGMDLDLAGFFALKNFMAASAAIIVIYIAIIFLKRYSDEKVARINGAWIAVYFAFLGYYKSIDAVVESQDIKTLTLWTGFVLVGGMIWEMAKGTDKFLESGQRSRNLFIYLSVLIVMLSVCTVTMGAGTAELMVEYASFYTLGILFLGFPMVMYCVIPELVDYAPAKGALLLVLFGLGCLSAALVMLIDPYEGWHLAAAPPMWAAILALAGKALARLESRLDGLVGGIALGLGFSAFWIYPQFIPVPFINVVNQMQMQYLAVPLGRGILYAYKMPLFVLAAGAGGITGLAFGPRLGNWIKIGAVVIAMLLLAGGVFALPAIFTGHP